MANVRVDDELPLKATMIKMMRTMLITIMATMIAMLPTMMIKMMITTIITPW